LKQTLIYLTKSKFYRKEEHKGINGYMAEEGCHQNIGIQPINYKVLKVEKISIKRNKAFDNL